MVHCFRFISKCSILCTNCVERKIGVIIVFVLSYYVSLCSYLFHYDLPLPPVVYMRAIVLFTLFMYVWCSGVQHILCCAILFYLRLVSCVPNVASFSGFSILDCPFCFLWIFHSWLPLLFSLDCPFLIGSSVFSIVYFNFYMDRKIFTLLREKTLRTCPSARCVERLQNIIPMERMFGNGMFLPTISDEQWLFEKGRCVLLPCGSYRPHALYPRYLFPLSLDW